MSGLSAACRPGYTARPRRRTPTPGSRTTAAPEVPRSPAIPTIPPPRPTWLSALACAAMLAAPAALTAPALGQPAGEDLDVRPPADLPGGPVLDADVDAVGLTVVAVDVVGNERSPDRFVLNAARTRPGDAFDPRTVTADYQRIYALGRFKDVVARYEVIETDAGPGVKVVFEVAELPAVAAVRFRGNRAVKDATLQRLIEARAGLAAGGRGDPVLLAFAADAIREYYESQNYPLASVRAARDDASGATVFDVVEGPKVFVRNVDFLGNESFDEPTLKGQIATKVWAPLGLFGFTGRYDEDTIEEDVVALRRFYQREKGFFDARVGRRVVWSADLSEVQVEYLIEEGRRYEVGEIEFEGVEALDADELRRRVAEEARLVPGAPYDADRVRAAVQEIVDAYSPLGFVYDPPPPGIEADPAYLSVGADESFRMEPGVVDLTFRVREGRPFRVGEIRVRGNAKTQDKVILRAFDAGPGDLYDSADVRDATRRLQASRYFGRVRVTPVLPPGGDVDEPVRDVLVEVEEISTAVLGFSGGLSSNGGVFGQIQYEQRNFDLFDLPESLPDLYGNAFQGAGQTFRVSIEPGTVRSNASVSFYEPYVLDRNFGAGADGYYRTFRRREYRSTSAGGRLRVVPRLGRYVSTSVSLRGEDVRVFDLDAPESDRAADYREFEGHTTITSLGAAVAYTRIDTPVNTASGYRLAGAWESFGVLGGPSFQKATASVNGFVPLFRDGRDRAIVFEVRGDAGAIYNSAPFFERFFEGGFGSVRGFRFRGISPRQGPADDPVGGDFSATGSAALGFPLYSRLLRGTLFVDAGSVSPEPDLGTVRAAAGFGFRLTLDALGGVPIAFDFAWPLNKPPGGRRAGLQLLARRAAIAPIINRQHDV